jgi:bifunctional DNA-binding transcriptional regulator/antitoxin component of YhaV-PrlF toxin-antitoxin module
MQADGTVTLPAEVLKSLALSKGDRIQFVEIDAGLFRLVPIYRSATKPRATFGTSAKSSKEQKPGS